jgi:ubiquinone biosynthesis protein
LSILREEVATSDLLPKAYHCYCRLLADALCFFLRRLSSVRLRHILAEQMHLPRSVSTAERVVRLLSHLPALHKLGQVVARDHRLNAGFRCRLQRLESMAPQIPAAQVLRLLEKEFKNWQTAGIELGPAPLAEGSVAVIMPFAWRDGRARSGARHGVFKLLKPGVSGMLEEDLEILSVLGEFLDEECERFGLPALDYRDSFNTIKDLLLHEVRFDEEQRNLAEAAAIYGSMRSVTIPSLFPFCSSRLTAMEQIFGHKVTGNGLSNSLRRELLARAAVQALIATPIFSAEAAALFHADPHAGNLLITQEGGLGILDWSLGGRLRKRQRVELIQVVVGALTLNPQRMEQAVERLSQREPVRLALREILDDSLRELAWGTFPGITWLTRLLDKLMLGAGVRLDADLLLFRKSLLTLAGVVRDLTKTDEPDCNALLDETVKAAFTNHWIAEWPRRFQTRFDDRSFTTHLSTADLVWLMWSAPTTFARGWTEAGLKILRGNLAPSGPRYVGS